MESELSFYELSGDEKATLKAQGGMKRRGSAGVRFGNPAHLLDAAKYVKEAWDNLSPISVENCFRKADISIEYQEEMRLVQDIAGDEQIYQLVEGMEELSVEDINGFVHADDADSTEFVEAIKDDMNDLMEELHQVQLILNEESEEEENKNDEAFSMDDPHPFVGIEDVFADILSLGPKIQHSDFEEQSMGLHQNICGAYENLLSIAMNIKRERTRRMAMRPKIQLAIRDFYE